ncbi:MAG: glycosyltransferase family 4 protein [Vicinamibacterales bacterium]
MRIVHLITHLRLGAGRVIVDLAVHQATHAGHRVMLVVSADAEGGWRSDPLMAAELRAAGVAVGTTGDFFHRDPARLDHAATRLRSLIGAWDANTVVHSHTAPGIAVARWSGAPRVIATCHGWSLDRPAEYVLQDALAFSLADAIVSPSTYWAERVAALPGHPRVEVVPYGFDLSRYVDVIPQAGTRGSARIACVGELTARKGQDLLLDAMPAVWAARPDAELHLFGDGDLRPALEARVRTLGADGSRVFLHGHVVAPYRTLPNYDLLVLPTRSDNQPVAIVEAMLAGMPIVSTIVGGIPEMIDQAGCGETVPSDRSDALSAGMLRVLARPDFPSLGARGRAFASSAYDVGSSAVRHEAIYGGVAR